ncbi:BfmA/BtgA family mobilization protein [Mammaliicoccus sciuri]|uniref:BfmA/BtgA family mobilization protein n=1 Tax=Mammaliicoccus sciuri TaxID=1296 RepID=UPI002737E3FF|nr:BfmA/BtgA family mobilization protein [Mammaliicoccus sciuri]
MSEDTILKRVHIKHEVNEKIKKLADERKLNHSEFINLALDYFIEYEENGQKHKEDDIYTLRISELTQAVNRMRYEFQNGMESNAHIMEQVVETFNSPSYLKSDE